MNTTGGHRPYGAPVDPFRPKQSSEVYEPVADSSDPVSMTHLEFLERAIWDPERSLQGVPVRLEGLVLNSPAVPDGFKLTKFELYCCTADAIPRQMLMRNTPTFKNNTWVVVDALWLPPPAAAEPGSQRYAQAKILDVEITEAKYPYESPH